MKKKLVACMLAVVLACLSVSALVEGYDDGLWGAAGAYATDVSGDKDQNGQSSETQKNNGGKSVKSDDVFAGDPLVFTEGQMDRVVNARYQSLITIVPVVLYLVDTETNDAGEMTITMRLAAGTSDQMNCHFRVDVEIGSSGLQRVVDHGQVTLPGTESVDTGLASVDFSFAISNPSLEDIVLHVRICPESSIDVEEVIPIHFIAAATEEKDVHVEAIEKGGYASPEQVIAEEKDFSIIVYWIEWNENGSLEVCADIKHNFSKDPDVTYADLSVNGIPLTKGSFVPDSGEHFGFCLYPDDYPDGKTPEKIKSVSFRPIVYSDELENNPCVCDRITYYMDIGGTEAHLPAWNGENMMFEEPAVVLDYEGYKLSLTGIIREEYDDEDDDYDYTALVVQGKAERPFDDEVYIDIRYVADGKNDNEACFGDDFSFVFYDKDTIPSEMTLSLTIYRLCEWIDEDEYDEEEYAQLKSSLGDGQRLVSSYTPDGNTTVVIDTEPLLKASSIKLYFDQ